MIILGDDGTLDTVIRCTQCGEEFRFNFDPENATEEYTYADFIENCIDEITDEHECDTEEDAC